MRTCVANTKEEVVVKLVTLGSGKTTGELVH